MIKKINYFIKILIESICYKLILLNVITRNELNTSQNVLKE